MLRLVSITLLVFGAATSLAAPEDDTRERDRLRESLGRVGDDDYGVCEVCRCFIGTERLLALPSTKRCVRCAN